MPAFIISDLFMQLLLIMDNKLVIYSPTDVN